MIYKQKVSRQVSWLRIIISQAFPDKSPVVFSIKLPITVAGPLKIITSFPILPEGHLLLVFNLCFIKLTLVNLGQSSTI